MKSSISISAKPGVNRSERTESVSEIVAKILLDKGPLILFGLLLLYMALFAPYFLEWQNITTIFRQTVPLSILCFGLATVVVTGGDDVVVGGIDLSIPAGSVMAAAICSVLLVKFNVGLPIALTMAVLAALAVGIVNAALVVVVGLTPLLATLASSVAVVGITKLITSHRRINVDHPFINSIRDDSFIGIPISVLIMLLVFLIIAFLIHQTPWGMRMQAVGGSRSAAEISGLKPAKYIAQSFFIASVIGAIASVTIIARGSGSSPGTEDSLLIEMVLATFVGAAFSPRRVVTIWGALLGALLVNGLSNGFALMRVDIFWIGGIKGALILIVVATAAIQRRGERS
jgi:ribose transport system permease protein